MISFDILFKLQHNFTVLGAAAKYDVLTMIYLNNICRKRMKDNDELPSWDVFFSWLVIDGLCRVKSESRALSHPLCDQCKHTDWLFHLTSSSSFGCLSGIYRWCVPSRPRHNALTDGFVHVWHQMIWLFGEVAYLNTVSGVLQIVTQTRW